MSCSAIKQNGKQCKKNRVINYSICAVHLRSKFDCGFGDVFKLRKMFYETNIPRDIGYIIENYALSVCDRCNTLFLDTDWCPVEKLYTCSSCINMHYCGYIREEDFIDESPRSSHILKMYLLFYRENIKTIVQSKNNSILLTSGWTTIYNGTLTKQRDALVKPSQKVTIYTTYINGRSIMYINDVQN